MSLVSSYQGRELICEKSFSFFKEGNRYFCIYDTKEYFYIWCDHNHFGVNEIKLSSKLKQHFRVSNF